MLTIPANAPSMTSREIADLTGKQHKHVIRDIKAMLMQIYDLKDGPNLDHVEIKGVFVEHDERGYIAQIYLDKDHTLTLLTGYDANARMRVIKRWQELEGQSAPMTMAERLLASAKLLVDHERKLADLSYRQAETQAQVKAIVDGEDYYTIVGYGNLIGEPVDIHRSRKIGRIASRICRENDWRIGTANHPVYGPIHSYPRQAVAMAFDAE